MRLPFLYEKETMTLPYRSKRQQAYFHAKLKKLAKRWDKETYKSKAGSKANKRKFASLPKRKKKKP